MGKYGIYTLVMILVMTSARVQTAEAGNSVPGAIFWETGYVEQNDMHNRGIVVPRSLNGSLQVAPSLPTKWSVRATVTAYSSSPSQTDDTPLITADGSHVRDGIVAANWLKFGTRVRIPELFGSKVFEVHDRMSKRFSDRLDVWVDSESAARSIGVRRNIKIEIL